MCYTSGTTGRPKGVVYSHRSMVLHTLVGNQPDHWNLASKDSVLPVTPMFHANCWGIPYGAAMMGIKLVFPGPHLGAADLLDLFMTEKPTLLARRADDLDFDPAAARLRAASVTACRRACACSSAARRCRNR